MTGREAPTAELSGTAGYLARWRPSSVTPQAACFARQVVAAVAPPGRERAKNLLWAAGRLADWAIGPGLEPVPQVLLHPSVIERFTAHAPGLTGVTRRTLRTNLRLIARRVVPQLHPADLPLPRERAKVPYSPAEIGGYLALADAQPTAARRPGPCRSWPATTRFCWHQPGSPGRTWSPAAPIPPVITSRTRWPGRWPAAPACQRWRAPGCGPPGWPTAPGCSAWRLSWPLPGSPAASGSAISSPACSPAARSRRWRCSAVSGEHPAGRAREHHRYLRRGSGDREDAARRGTAPAADGRYLTGRDDAHPGRCPARAPDQGAPGADRPARARPGPARRRGRVEDRPAPAHLPAGRAHL